MAKKPLQQDAAPNSTTKAKSTVSAATEAVRSLTPAKLKRAQKTKKKRKSTRKQSAEPKIAKAKINPHVTRPTPEEQDEINERRFIVWDYFKSGVSMRQICAHLKEKGIAGTSLGTVHSDIQFCLDYQTDELGLSVEQWRANELAVLQDIRFTYLPLMKRTGFNVLQEDKTDAAKIVLATHDKICKLLNLHKEPKVMLGLDDELAKLLNISPDQLPKPDGDQPES